MKSTRLGILGGGQLGKMLAQAASPWDINLSILDPTAGAPAAHLCQRFVQGDFRDYDTVMDFGEHCDAITIEIEQVNVEALESLEAQGKHVSPPSKALRIIQDKGLQKKFYAEHELPTADFELYPDAQAVRAAVAAGVRTLPFVQKSRTDGYDGRGVFVVRDMSDLDNLLPGPCVAEDAVDMEMEIAVIAARNPAGEVRCFPAVEMAFHPTANLVEFLACPARIPDEATAEAECLAIQCIEAFELTGLLAVELFLDKGGRILINEVAPRPHNSGHHTIEACVTSQYQQHLRCALDLPLGSPELRSPGVMINLLGEPDASGPVVYKNADKVLATEGAFVHLYGKHETRPFRKMGHVTVIDEDLDEAIQKARTIQKEIKVTV